MNELKPEYRQVCFRCSQEDLSTDFFIVTAYNPDGRTVEDSVNRIADTALLNLISDHSLPHFRVIGGNPDFSHAEPGYGTVCTKEEALMLAREFRQDAIFEVRAGEVFLLSAKAANAEPEMIGKWNELVDAQ